MTLAVAWWFVGFPVAVPRAGSRHAVDGGARGFPVARAVLARAGARHVHHAEHRAGCCSRWRWCGPADTGAFFAGRWFGRVPLAPRVSPKKTWEGVLGGLARERRRRLGRRRNGCSDVDAWPFVITCVAVAALSIVGDLTESMLKRAAGLKDSGTLFPGHGGMLDRIDSVTAAAPALVFALIGLEVIA